MILNWVALFFALGTAISAARVGGLATRQHMPRTALFNYVFMTICFGVAGVNLWLIFG